MGGSSDSGLSRQTFDEFLIEIMGFWSPDDVKRKLALLGQADIGNLIL